MRYLIIFILTTLTTWTHPGETDSRGAHFDDEGYYHMQYNPYSDAEKARKAAKRRENRRKLFPKPAIK